MTNKQHLSDKNRINSTAMFSYTITVSVLIISYFIEVLKKSRTVPYFLVFLALVLVPYTICQILFQKDRESERVRYIRRIYYLKFVRHLYILVTACLCLCHYGGGHSSVLQSEQACFHIYDLHHLRQYCTSDLYGSHPSDYLRKHAGR